jgi:hypothetical protein
MGYCNTDSIFIEDHQNHEINQEDNSTPNSEDLADKTLREFSSPSVTNIRTGLTLIQN